MPDKVVKDKVLRYVVWDGRLLVFRHTDYSYEQVRSENSESVQREAMMLLEPLSRSHD